MERAKQHIIMDDHHRHLRQHDDTFLTLPTKTQLWMLMTHQLLLCTTFPYSKQKEFTYYHRNRRGSVKKCVDEERVCDRNVKKNLYSSQSS